MVPKENGNFQYEVSEDCPLFESKLVSLTLVSLNDFELVPMPMKGKIPIHFKLFLFART
jgi:hypothetical protein